MKNKLEEQGMGGGAGSGQIVTTPAVSGAGDNTDPTKPLAKLFIKTPVRRKLPGFLEFIKRGK